jgi:uncharacterized protein YjdB
VSRSEGYTYTTIGTVGQSLRLEAIDVDGSCLAVNSHVQDIGWQGYRYQGWSGTVGQGRRIEAVQMHVSPNWVYGSDCTGLQIQYAAHVEGIGWMPWVNAGQVAGTTGQARRLEAIMVRWIGSMPKCTEWVDGDCWY